MLRILPLLFLPSLAAADLVEHTIVVNGQERTYFLSSPPGGSSTLVISMHGGGGQADTFARRSGLLAEAENQGVYLLAPQGLSESWRHTDDASAMTRKARLEAGDDLAFFLALESLIPAGVTRVYGTGVSAGGMMLYRVACQQPVFLDAIAVVSATMTVSPAECEPMGTSLLHIHGAEDTNVPYDGSGGGSVFAPVDYPAVYIGLDEFWLENNCSPVTSQRISPTLVRYSAPCANGEVVEFDYHENRGHDWYADSTARVVQFFSE